MELAQSRIDVRLPLLGRMILRVLAEITMRPCLQDFLRQFVTELVLEDRDLFFQLFNEIDHSAFIIRDYASNGSPFADWIVTICKSIGYLDALSEATLEGLAQNLFRQHIRPLIEVNGINCE